MLYCYQLECHVSSRGEASKEEREVIPRLIGGGGIDEGDGGRRKGASGGG